MTRKELRNLVFGLALGLLGAGALAEIALPHTFTSGTTIRANEVNANFQALGRGLPGVAQTVSPDAVPITPTPAVDSVTINVPGPGFVKVSATAQLNIEYSGGSNAAFTLGVANAADTFRPAEDRRIAMPAGLPAGTYSYIVSAERVFPVDTPGPKTFYLLAEENTAAQGTVSRRTLTATFLTAMGTVQNP
ncbi:hypothetical protein [Meiothermus taiwanensis]|jgi:hypothetical protein|uniref:Uncharacterized protein n=2 Tax=Meiothermus taiwanensis TaxID=172827 RepID=A0A399E4N0_9DEIN|nr:hypothetical protein [Meiothermus taiwanensis]AWR88055.1 hypothetical protein Mtai_v1c28320 [Meiothermus taiwanensis WR-220]KIQ54219.1 hypothetical protein SY28_09740 [Meiothermus taiwanensis]KZK15815.1 hypothetical protein A3962_08885 [Meiothermus taiwanensis]RIH77171.1 hypothetical protein Mcate_01424 [Meiothermus taiwanensis]